MAEFAEFIRLHRREIEEALWKWLPARSGPGAGDFNRALEYAVFPGGKRLRAYLTFIASGLAGLRDEQTVLRLSCATEFLHTSSIIFDDLPAMDNARARRGRPAHHLVFGEGQTLLVGVALVNQAYALFSASVPEDVLAERLHHLLNCVTECVGNMIAGQSTDLLGFSAEADSRLVQMPPFKTTALMQLAMTAGGIVNGSPEADLKALSAFGEQLGEAYQVCDDLLDAGEDLKRKRGEGGPGAGCESHASAARRIRSAEQALTRFGNRAEAELLRSVAAFVIGSFSAVHPGHL